MQGCWEYCQTALQSLEVLETQGDHPPSPTTKLLQALEGRIAEPQGDKSKMVSLGAGLSTLPRRTVERIKALEFVDFNKLPPAKGKMRASPHSSDGRIVVVQAEDLMQSKKLIPDLQTWLQCFALYVAVAAADQPEKLPDLMSLIAKASKKFRWPSWVVYDTNFRMEVAGKPDAAWAKVDPSIYSQCFMGMAVSTEGWCQRCQSLDHGTGDCPTSRSMPRKRPWQPAAGQGGWQMPRQAGAGPSPPAPSVVCQKFNKYDGDCRFPHCKYRHVCSSCGGDHAVKRCPGGAS